VSRPGTTKIELPFQETLVQVESKERKKAKQLVLLESKEEIEKYAMKNSKSVRHLKSESEDIKAKEKLHTTLKSPVALRELNKKFFSPIFPKADASEENGRFGE
jgi:hypothetical protein